LHLRVIGDVEGQCLDGRVAFAKLLQVTGVSRVATAGQHGPAVGRKLSRQFQANAAIGARDQYRRCCHQVISANNRQTLYEYAGRRQMQSNNIGYRLSTARIGQTAA
jgi:hypothetical protein